MAAIELEGGLQGARLGRGESTSLSVYCFSSPKTRETSSRKRVGPWMVTVWWPKSSFPPSAATSGVAWMRTGPFVSQRRVTSSPGQATGGVVEK